MTIISRTCAVILLITSLATAATYHSDPATGSNSNDGSAGNPWGGLDDIIGSKTFSAGDTLIMHAGLHGRPYMNNMTYAAPVVFKAAPGENPLMTGLSLGTARNMVFDGITFTPEAVTPYVQTDNIATLTGGATFITVQNCSLYSKKSIEGWDTDDWHDYTAKYGIRIDGAHNTIRNNYIAHIRYGIMVNNNAPHTLVEYNTIEEFCVDGINGLGDSSTYQYNVVKNSYGLGEFRDGIDYHEDAFQSWAVPQGGGASIKGVTLRGNHFLNYETRDQPYRSNMQGMGCFDGNYEDWLIVNNLIVADMWHGAALFGAINCTIINNTVMSPADAELTQLWVGIFKHKNGTEGGGCLVRNNLTSFLNIDESPTTVADHNIAGTHARIFIMDHAGNDYTLKPGAPAVGGIPAIDGGSAESAPLIDKNGVARPQGAGVDIGCFEHLAAPVRNAGYRPRAYGLSSVQVGPQPLKTDGTLSYTLDRAATVNIQLHRADGGMAFADEFITKSAGSYRHALNTEGLSAGMYIYRVTVDGFEYSRGQLIVE